MHLFSRVVVTGGAGFIGSHLVRSLVRQGRDVLCIDKLSYAGHRFSLKDVEHHSNLQWSINDLAVSGWLEGVLTSFQPDAILHLAAESHVDRSIDAPELFAVNNVLGTVHLLSASLRYRDSLAQKEGDSFRFVQLSTDEVFGSIDSPSDKPFTASTPYRPNSPYSASKGAADHFVNAFRRTYGLNASVLYCSNNYGPYQHPEKLLPKSILNAIDESPIPLYGDGANVRDWLHVSDHVAAILALLDGPAASFSHYAIGGNSPVTNIEILSRLCIQLDEIAPRGNGRPYADLITRVADRPGHDFKYEVDSTHFRKTFDWSPQVPLDEGLADLARWYIRNQPWVQKVIAKSM